MRVVSCVKPSNLSIYQARYRSLYEERLNPFAAFHRKERMQRINELHAAERLVLNFSSFFLANRHARLFLFGYILCLHLLVSCSTYLITHHTHVDCGK